MPAPGSPSRGPPDPRPKKRLSKKSQAASVSPDAHAAGENRSELDSRLRARTTRVFFHKLSAPDAFSGVRGAFPITASAADQADAHRADLGRDTGGHHTVIGDEHLIAYGKTAQRWTYSQGPAGMCSGLGPGADRSPPGGRWLASLSKGSPHIKWMHPHYMPEPDGCASRGPPGDPGARCTAPGN